MTKGFQLLKKMGEMVDLKTVIRNKRALPTIIITCRNEVVAKIIFLHLSVILFTGGVCLSACWDTNPPQEGGPPEGGTPPGRRPPWEGPPGRRPPSPPAYGQ